MTNKLNSFIFFLGLSFWFTSCQTPQEEASHQADQYLDRYTYVTDEGELNKFVANLVYCLDSGRIVEFAQYFDDQAIVYNGFKDSKSDVSYLNLVNKVYQQGNMSFGLTFGDLLSIEKRDYCLAKLNVSDTQIEAIVRMLDGNYRPNYFHLYIGKSNEGFRVVDFCYPGTKRKAGNNFFQLTKEFVELQKRGDSSNKLALVDEVKQSLWKFDYQKLYDLTSGLSPEDAIFENSSMAIARMLGLLYKNPSELNLQLSAFESNFGTDEFGLYILLIDLCLANDDFEGALKMIAKFESSFFEDLGFDYLKGYISEANADFSKAYSYYASIETIFSDVKLSMIQFNCAIKNQDFPNLKRHAKTLLDNEVITIEDVKSQILLNFENYQTNDSIQIWLSAH